MNTAAPVGQPTAHPTRATHQEPGARHWLAILAMALVTATPAHAQFVKGNEALTVSPDGQRTVDLPPMPRNGLPPACRHDQNGCAMGGWLMVETDLGLSECTEFQARDGTCRPSSFGQRKLSRRWIVKSNGKWLQCQVPAINSKCVGLSALPLSAMQ